MVFMEALLHVVHAVLLQEFEINDELLTYLYNTHNTDTNPQSGQINFDLECYVKQGDDSNIYYEERMTTRIEVLRIYDNGNYTKEEIGMIGIY